MSEPTARTTSPLPPPPPGRFRPGTAPARDPLGPEGASVRAETGGVRKRRHAAGSRTWRRSEAVCCGSAPRRARDEVLRGDLSRTVSVCECLEAVNLEALGEVIGCIAVRFDQSQGICGVWEFLEDGALLDERDFLVVFHPVDLDKVRLQWAIPSDRCQAGAGSASRLQFVAAHIAAPSWIGLRSQ
ncbi:hypothetical protein SPHV1_470060 [Novosphingobium sp. KN65.2]|nr:hypothetical protein SPHV1_470060 [Novosphingobium sp. KN65.2]